MANKMAYRIMKKSVDWKVGWKEQLSQTVFKLNEMYLFFYKATQVELPI